MAGEGIEGTDWIVTGDKFDTWLEARSVREGDTTIRIIVDTLGRLEDKSDRLAIRIDTLVDTTNHRLDDFRETMALHRASVDAALAKKADDSDLLESIGFKLGNNKVVRWAIGIAAASILATATFAHWWVSLLQWLEGLVK